jgi:hypothetical protein
MRLKSDTKLTKETPLSEQRASPHAERVCTQRLYGALLITQPSAGRIAIAWLLGVYALIFGMLTLLLALRLRGMREASVRQAARPV